MNQASSSSSSSVSSSTSPRSTNIRHRGDCRCDVCIKKYKFAPSLHNLTKNSSTKSTISENGATLTHENDSNSMNIQDLVSESFDILNSNLTLFQSKQPILTSSPPPPATHCNLNLPSIIDDVKPLDLTMASMSQLTKQQNEQPLNLCSKRKRNPPVSLSALKRNKTTPSVVENPAANVTAAAAAAAAAASSMFIPFYGISPFFDPTTATNQQEIFQQFQALYLQMQQQQQKLTNNIPAKGE